MLPYGYNQPSQSLYPPQAQYPQEAYRQFPPNIGNFQPSQSAAQQKPASPKKTSNGKPGEKPQRFDHINLVEEPIGRRGGLYIGDILSSVIPEILGPANIRAILSVGHDAAFVPEDCPYKKIEANKAILAQDIPNYDMSQHFDEAIAFIEEQLNAGRNLLVHCHAGVSRSATVMIAYLMTKNQWNYDDALAFLRTKRKWVRPNPGFEKQLRDYEARLQAARKSYISVPALRTSSSQPNLQTNTRTSLIQPPQQHLQVSTVQPQQQPTISGQVPLQLSESRIGIVPVTSSKTFPLSNQLGNSNQPLQQIASLNGPYQPQPTQPTAIGYNLGFAKRQRTPGISEGANIKTSLWTDVGSLCSFADGEQLQFGGRPQVADYTQFSNARKSQLQPATRLL